MTNVDVYYAIDIGATKTDLGLVDAKGNILQRKVVDTPRDPNEAVDYLKKALKEFVESQYGSYDSIKSKIKAIGVGAPNIKGGSNGGIFGTVVPFLPGWENFNLRETLKTIGTPIGIENDSDAATIGAFLFDKNQVKMEKLPFMYLTVSSGVGGGILFSDSNQSWRLLRGLNDEHPEFGHMPFFTKSSGEQDVECGCKMKNCLASYISGKSIEKRYGVKPENASQKIKNEVAKNLGKALYIISLHYGPRYISLGGGVCNGWGIQFIDNVRKNMQAYYDNSKLMTPPELELCSLGNGAGLLGAAAVAIKAYKDSAKLQ